MSQAARAEVEPRGYQPPGPLPGSVEPSAAYLLGRLQVVETRVRALVDDRRRNDRAPGDPFRGLYLSDEHVDDLLSGPQSSRVVEWDDAPLAASVERKGMALEVAGTPVRLWSLANRAGLEALDTDLLMVALAPDLDSRFERLYGYLNDDVTRRRATIGLSLELCGASAWSATARRRLSPDAPLTAAGLVLVEEMDRPFLSRSLRVPDRVAAHLLGDDSPDPVVAKLARSPSAVGADGLAARLASVLSGGVRLIYLREHAGAWAPAVAAGALGRAGFGALTVDLDHLDSQDEFLQVAKIVGREALLTGAGVVAGPIEAVLDRPRLR